MPPTRTGSTTMLAMASTFILGLAVLITRTLISPPLPAGVRLRQIHADADAFCRDPGPVEGVDREHDYIVLPGGHSSLVIAQHFYAAAREFLDETDEAELEASP